MGAWPPCASSCGTARLTTHSLHGCFGTGYCHTYHTLPAIALQGCLPLMWGAWHAASRGGARGTCRAHAPPSSAGYCMRGCRVYARHTHTRPRPQAAERQLFWCAPACMHRRARTTHACPLSPPPPSCPLMQAAAGGTRGRRSRAPTRRSAGCALCACTTSSAPARCTRMGAGSSRWRTVAGRAWWCADGAMMAGRRRPCGWMLAQMQV